MIQNFSLGSGDRPIVIERILVQRTYIGVLEGRPRAEDNARCIDRFKVWVRETTACESLHVFAPVVDESNGYPRLPDYACAMELTSLRPAVDMSADLSDLVVIWFQAQSPLSGTAQIFELLKQLRWEDYAKDGYW